MRAKVLFAGAILLALTYLTASYAFGCDSDDANVPGRCVRVPTTTLARKGAGPLQIAMADPVARPTPKGDSPATAREPMYVKPEYCIEEMCPGAVSAPAFNSKGNWGWIDSNSSTWYKLDDGHSLQVQIWLFANGQSGLSFDVYAPDQKDLYGKPIGRGSLNPSQRPADLFYSGRTAAGGTWYIRVNNSNPFPVSYSLRFTRTTPAIGNVCDSCHRAMGDLMFDQCTNGAGSSWCQDLYWLYEQNPSTFDHSIPGK